MGPACCQKHRSTSSSTPPACVDDPGRMSSGVNHPGVGAGACRALGSCVGAPRLRSGRRRRDAADAGRPRPARCPAHRQRGPPRLGGHPVDDGGGHPLSISPLPIDPCPTNPITAAPSGVSARDQRTEATQSDGGPEVGVNFPPLQGGRVQAVIAKSSASRSDGFMNSSLLRGRLFMLRAMASRSSSVSNERSVPLGMY